MSDAGLMAETALIILEEGCGVVRTIREGRMRIARFMAGTVPLNGQAVTDLINAGWLKARGPRDYAMDAIPSFVAAAAPRASYGGTA